MSRKQHPADRCACQEGNTQQTGVHVKKATPGRQVCMSRTEEIKNEIKRKNILNQEYKSIMDDDAKLQKEKEYQQQKNDR